MSIAGIDFGNLNTLISLAGKGGVDVILNDSSNRQTATCVSVQGKQRFLGDAAAGMARSNIFNTITCMKLLVGRRFDSPDVQAEISRSPFKCAPLPNGGVGIKLMYNDSELIVSAEQVMGMMLVKAKDIAMKANSNVNIGDAVLAVPHWFTDSQRRGVLLACEIASLNCLKVTNESNAIALSYGIFKSAKKMFSETEPIHIMFIDMGYSGFCVTIVSYIQENMRVLSTVCERNLGGRDFDDVIIEFLAESFQKKTGINVRGNWKATLKLQVGAEKAKKTLSPAGVMEASISVECLAEDRDLSVILTRDEFEARSAPLVARLEAPIMRALSEAGLTRELLSEVEVVGGGSRVNCVKRRLGEILGLDASAMNYGLKTTMNADEAVARGSALQCALLSSRMKVKTFNIIDKLPYGIVALYDSNSASTSGDGDSNDAASGSSAALYSAGGDLPHKPRRLTFKRKTSDFTVTLRYDDESIGKLPAGEDPFLARYTIKLPSTASGNDDVRVTFNIDKHGCVYLQSAQLMEELPPEPVAATADEGKEAKEGKEDGKADGKEADPQPPKKRFRKTELEIVANVFGLSREDVRLALDLEGNMAYEDRLIVETSDKRNELEAYIYSMRDKLDASLRNYCTTTERDTFKRAIDGAEEWLYGDGFDSTKAEYVTRIEGLRAMGNPIENRLSEEGQRPQLLESLRRQLDLCKTFASNYSDAYAHITEEERKRLRDAVNSTESWMFDMQGQQGDRAQNVDPVLTCAGITKKREELFNISNPIMTKPKPKPAPAPAPAPTPAADSKDAKDSKDTSAPMDQEEPSAKSDGAASEDKDGSGPMET